MKKRTIRLVLTVLCLLCTVALASCFKEKEPVVEHEHEWDEGVITVQGNCQTGEEGEITYTCTICGEKKTEKTDGHDWGEGVKIYQETCTETGMMRYVCKRCGESKVEEIPKSDEHLFGEARLVTPPTADKEGVEEKVCSRCGIARTFPSEITYGAYQSKVRAARSKAASVTVTTDTSIRSDLGTKYATPSVTPTAGQHPRVMFNQNDISGIQRALNNGMNVTAAKEFRKQVALLTDGALPSATVHGSNGTFNFNGKTLSDVMALALDYQLTKNEITGYQAIYAAKNYLKTLDIQSFKPDPERTVGNVMYGMACVYDWCHDLLTEADKTQIVAGVQHKLCELTGTDLSNGKTIQFMEVGFPPSGQNPVAGHGCEFQILRDYLSFAIAIYDEYPGWWNFVGGRFYQDYVPVRNEFYTAGMVPQGVSQYVQIRFAADCYAAQLIKAMSGRLPFNAVGMKQVMRTVYSHELPGQYSFASGDGSNDSETVNQIKKMMDFGMAAMISSHLFDDATIRAQFEANKNSYSVFGDGQYGLEQTVGYACEELICSSGEVKAAKDLHAGMDLVVYNGGWLGQMIARNSWKDDQAAVLMKIGVRADSNHGHADAGQFQIWYKGMLAGDTGAYASYNTDHWKYYHQATVAHNCLLIKGSGQTSRTAEPSGLTAWKSGTYDTGVVRGFDYGYADEAKTRLNYAYIAGDIAKAYGSSVASEVQRRMLAVYDTGNADVPMFFFVFDKIASKSASDSKTFLLHIASEPTINGKTVTSTSGQGKLVLQNVFGAENSGITAIGGAGKNYWANGKQYTPNRYPLDGFWGRVEITTTASQLLNVMYVCDKSKSPNLTATAIGSEADAVKGAVIGNTAAAFVVSQTRQSSAFSFTATGTGNLNYYVSGVAAGNWTVSVGRTTQTVAASSDGGFLSFTAPAGKVTLTPAN